MAKFTQKTTKRTTATLKVGGDEREPKRVWERIVATVLDKLPLSGSFTVERVVTTEQEAELNVEEIREFARINKNQETKLSRRTQIALEEEAKSAERKKLKAGQNPTLPMPGSTAEQIDVLQAAKGKLRELRELGYEIDFREKKPPTIIIRPIQSRVLESNLVPTLKDKSRRSKKAGSKRKIDPCGDD